MDANAKLGDKIIKGDPNEMSANGELLYGIIQRQGLIIGNTLDVCDGVITRRREVNTVNGIRIEESVIDYILFCEKMAKDILKMDIDEKEDIKMKKYASKRGINRNRKKSDHNSIVAKFDIKWEEIKNNERKEVFNFRNKENLKQFKEITEISTDLSSCFDGNESIEVKTENWMKKLNTKFEKCFKKIRTSKPLITEVDKKIKKCTDLKKSSNASKCKLAKFIVSNMIEKLENEISEHSAEENFNIINEQIKNITNLEGGLAKPKMWKVRKSVSPRAKDPPMAKYDKNGNLITTKEPLKNLYLETYIDRLRTRDIIPELNYLNNVNEELWIERLEQASKNKTPDWTIKQLELVLKTLKNDKARDPIGFTNEIFKEGGSDLKLSILKLMNNIKRELKPVEILYLANITTIYKNKGPRSDMNSDRGIFILTCLRSILDKLIYFDKRDRIDGEMTDSNIGGNCYVTFVIYIVQQS